MLSITISTFGRPSARWRLNEQVDVLGREVRLMSAKGCGLGPYTASMIVLLMLIWLHVGKPCFSRLRQQRAHARAHATKIAAFETPINGIVGSMNRGLDVPDRVPVGRQRHRRRQRQAARGRRTRRMEMHPASQCRLVVVVAVVIEVDEDLLRRRRRRERRADDLLDRLVAAAMASSRNCMLLTARKLAVPMLSAASSIRVISASMIRPTTSAAPCCETLAGESWRDPPPGDVGQADRGHEDVTLEVVVERADGTVVPIV